MTAAKRAFDGDVTDAMLVGDTSADGWIDGAKAGLAHLAAFSTGEMTFDPAVNGFTFDGVAPASTLQFLNEDMARAAGRWRFVIGADAEAAVLSAAPALTAEGCAATLNEMIAGPGVSFEPGRAEFSRDSADGLDEIARLAAECVAAGGFDIEVEGDALAEARAAEFAGFLERAGVTRPRIAAIGYGPAAAVEGMDSHAAEPPDQPLEFKVRERSAQ